MDAGKIWCRPESRQRWQQEMETKGFVADYECRQRREDGGDIIVLRTSTLRREGDGT